MAETKVAMVTGAARPWGMGRAAALGLARKGLNVAVADMREDWGEEAVAAIKKETGREAMFVKLDVSQRSSVQAAVEEVCARFGRIDALAHVAGIVDMKPIDQITEEHIDRIIGVNLKGTIFMCQAVVPVMRRQGGGRIVNTASLSAFRTLSNLSIYAASKAGVVAFSRGLAWEVAKDNIIVNIVAPGSMNNAMGSDAPPDPESAAGRAPGQRPFKEPTYPEDVAHLVILAATESTPVMSGQTLHANKGEYMA